MQRARTISFRTGLMCVAFLSWFCLPAHGHHGFASHFDPSREQAVEGVVTGYEFINPHVQIHLDVEVGEGGLEKWLIESASITTFYRDGGLSSDSLNPGDFVSIVGHPSRHGKNEMRLIRIRFPDGEELTVVSNLLRVPFLENAQ